MMEAQKALEAALGAARRVRNDAVEIADKAYWKAVEFAMWVYEGQVGGRKVFVVRCEACRVEFEPVIKARTPGDGRGDRIICHVCHRCYWKQPDGRWLSDRPLTIVSEAKEEGGAADETEKEVDTD